MKTNNLARWIIVAIAVGGILFNTAILYNDVKHIKNEIREIKQEMRDIRNYLLEKER